MCAYSPALRRKIVDAVDSNMTKLEVAELFGVGLSTVKRYCRQWRAGQSLAAKSHPGRPPLIRPDQQETLRAQVTAYPAAYLDEQCLLFATETGVTVSRSTMSRMIRTLGFTRKKGRWVPPSATTPDGPCGTASSAT